MASTISIPISKPNRTFSRTNTASRATLRSPPPPAAPPRRMLPLPKDLPVAYYPDTFLDMLIILPSPSLRPSVPVHRFPGGIAPILPYYSHLPPAKLGLDKAAQLEMTRPKDYSSPSHPDDKDIERTLYLSFSSSHPSRWAIVWCVPSRRIGDPACLRTLTLDSPSNINFGPTTRSENLTTMLTRTSSSLKMRDTRFLPIATLGLAARKDMDSIAWNIGVPQQQQPEFGSRNWVAGVLAVAVSRGLIKEENVRSVLNEALKRQPHGLVDEIYVEGF